MKGLYLFLAALALSACASVAPLPHRSTALLASQPLQRLQVAVDPAERDLLTALMAGELSLASAATSQAATFYADATQRSDDAGIAEQATHIALAAHKWDLARSGLMRWQTLRGEISGIEQARAIIAVHDGQMDAAFRDLSALARAPDDTGWAKISQALLSVPEKAAAGKLLARLLQSDGSRDSSMPSRVGDAYVLRTDQLGSNTPVWIAISQLAVRLERKDLAQALADAAVVRFHTPETYAWAAQLKLANGDKDGARRIFADALHPDQSAAPRGRHAPAVAADSAARTRLRAAYANLLSDMGENLEAARVLSEGQQSEYTYAARAAYLAHDEPRSATQIAGIAALYREVQNLPLPVVPARAQLLGQLAELLDRKSDALQSYQQIPADDDHWFSAQLRIAVLLIDSGKSEQGLNLLHELQARSGDDARQLGEAFLLEAELLTRLKRGADAVSVYSRGMNVLPDDTRLLYARALLNDQLDHVDAAVADLRRVLDLKPDDPEALNALGYTLADRTEKKSEALALIQKALSLKPEAPTIIDSLGWVEYRLGNLPAAVAQLRNAYQKMPDAEIAAHLGEVLWVSGKREEARDIWEQGRKKEADNKVLLETIKRLAS